MSRGNPRDAAVVGLATARRLIGAEQKEEDFQAVVLELAQRQGWLTYHTRDSRRSTPGFPDICAVRGRELLMAELKQEGEDPSPEQVDWLGRLARVETVVSVASIELGRHRGDVAEVGVSPTKIEWTEATFRCDLCGGTASEPWSEDPLTAMCVGCFHVCAHGPWVAIPGYDGYSASAKGFILGPRGRVMHPMPMPSGHLYILTRRPGVPRKLFVHRAVLMAFVGPAPSSEHEGRHLNGDPTCNGLWNLAWGTAQQNADDKQRHGTQVRGERAATAKLTEADVREIRRLHGTMTLRTLGARFGVSHTAIRRAATGAKWAHLG